MKRFKRAGSNIKIIHVTINKWITINTRVSGNSQINRNIGSYANEGGQNAKKGGKNVQRR
ncbi:hypothetical protein GXP70_18510 [Paenibacillus lycopersici]|uniref:Uncharacterized protein n=1 Tax=Paenibacillus lycopersici TaxID=2704462 RepID=A0A6C0G1J1_9BACL|nr:hypothetical protein [Paenibacillus lycopersici]QHT61773.1 hypothetical protein GXP70_18510 [Paenibacillus lycopersici]